MEKSNPFLLEVQNLSVAYGNIVAVSGVSLNVKKGTIVALIGANGAGKSTLLKAILGIQRTQEGTIRFVGNDITRKKVENIVASGIALIPEGRGIVMQMSVMENLELGAFHQQKNLHKNMEKVFGHFPILKGKKNQKAGLLSGGQQQMLAIGRAMIGDPTLIMMDEPSLGLAPIIIDQLLKTIGDMRREGNTILLAEQNARKALQIADYGYVFEKGRIVLEGDNGELSKNDMVRHAYLGIQD